MRVARCGEGGGGEGGSGGGGACECACVCFDDPSDGYCDDSACHPVTEIGLTSSLSRRHTVRL